MQSSLYRKRVLLSSTRTVEPPTSYLTLVLKIRKSSVSLQLSWGSVCLQWHRDVDEDRAEDNGLCGLKEDGTGQASHVLN